MGSHRKPKEKSKISVAKKRSIKNEPEWPNNIGKRRKIKSIWGAERHLIIEDEIMHQQSNAPHKLISFQKIRFEEENNIIRLKSI